MYTYYFEKLDVWRLSKDFVKEIYDLTNRFPEKDYYGLVSQIRRAVLSVPTNISEGSARLSKKDRGNFYMFSYSSLMELLNLLIISYEINYITEDEYIRFRVKINEIANKLNALYRSNSNR
jgi:four helix bundle protein